MAFSDSGQAQLDEIARRAALMARYIAGELSDAEVDSLRRSTTSSEWFEIGARRKERIAAAEAERLAAEAERLDQIRKARIAALVGGASSLTDQLLAEIPKKLHGME